MGRSIKDAAQEFFGGSIPEVSRQSFPSAGSSTTSGQSGRASNAIQEAALRWERRNEPEENPEPQAQERTEYRNKYGYIVPDEYVRQAAEEVARAQAEKKEAEEKRKAEAESYEKKGVLGRVWDVIRGIDDRAGQAFLANASGLAASVAGKDTAVSDVQAAAKLIADKDDGVSVGQALKRLDQQLGNRAVAGAASVADRIWNEIGGVINRFGGNVDTENDIFSRWNQNRQAVKAASTEALYGPDGIQGNAVSDWNERRVANQQAREEMYQNRYSESPVAQAVSKYGTMVWSQAPSAMLAVMMTVANPAAGVGTIANGLAPATTKGLGYIAALENSSGMKKLAMLAGNTIGNLAKDPQFWYSYSQEAGGAYNEAIQEGADPSTASLYASVYGALSGAIEIQGVFEGGNLEKLPGNIKKALMSGDKSKAAWMYVQSILGEIGEEEAQDMVSKLLKTTYRDDIPLYSTTDENAVINPRSMLETAKDTAITTALMGAGERAIMGTAQKVSDSRTYRGDAALLFEHAKQAGGEKNAEAIAKIEKAATNAEGSTRLNMGQARELYQIIRDNGGEEAYNEAAKTKNRQQIVGASIDAAFEGTNLDAKGRETLVNGFTPGETKLYDYTQGVKEAYNLGRENKTLDQATREATKGSALTEEQFRHAWQLGRSEVSSQSETVDPKTEEGKTRLTSELKVMGEHAEAAAAVYNEDQDVKTFATAMNTAANLYAAQGEKVKDFVADVREGKAASEIGYLTDAQLATAYQIGEALRQERQAAVKASAARFETIRARAQQITAQAASAAQIDKAITETRAYIQNETKQADELKAQADELINADEVPENAEEIWNRATAEEKEHRKNAEKAQETLKELEAKRKEIPATESAKTRGRATLASEGGRLTSNGGEQAKYEAVDASKLSKQQKTIVEAVDIIAQELGLDVLIVKGYGGWGGAYIGGGRILLNIYSGMNLKGFSKAIAASSFTHEMTHWLQEYASEEYDELKQYIRDSMGAEKYDALVKQEQRAGLTYEDAENEVVANACQPMLQNSKAFEQFAREHRSVAEKIRDFLKEFLDKIKAAFAEVDFHDDIPIYNAVKAVENELEGMQEIFDRALVRARENLQAERTVSNQTENRQETVSEQTENAAQLQSWDDMTEDERRAEINATMTMEQAKKMIQKAFIAGEIRDWYDEYHNGEEWLRGQGAADVAEVIENDNQLYMQYIGRNPHLTEYDFTMEEVIEAYLAGTLTGPVKAKAKRVDVTTGRGVKDSRFYSNTQGEPVTVKTWDLANSRATKSNQAAVNKARKDILLAAHNGNLARELGITDAELNKKLRSWSRYSAKARDASIRINAGVAPENRWTGIQNSSILAHIDMTDEDILSMVKSITGESEQYQRNYIGATMLALDTHINWSGLDFEFRRGNADPTDPKVLGYYTNNTRRIVVGGRGDMNTVAHEMGHALDYLWERELFAGKSSQPLTENTFDIEKIPDEDGRTFYKNFRTFMDNLMESGAIHSSYWMEQRETFARFVARFVEWTQEIAGSSYVRGEGLKFGDKFTTAQYLEFAKLLQEKAAWDSKRAAETGVQFQSWSMEEYEEYTKDFDEDGAYAAKREQQEEKRNIDAQIRERKPEENDWIDRVVKGEATPEQYEEWMKESGLDKLYERQREAEKHVEMLERRNRELVDSRLESEERAAIEKSGLTEAEHFRKEAVKEFGYTPYFYDAGYIMPNGKMLNFSGIKGKHTGRRAQDHRAIGAIFATTKGSDGMYRFVNDGNIRIMAEAPGLDISAEHEPTPEQYRQIKSFVRESMDEGYFAVDFTDATGRNTGSMEYDEDSHISADRIVRDIKYYYQTGEVPETQRYQFQSWAADYEESVRLDREIQEAEDALDTSFDSREQQKLNNRLTKLHADRDKLVAKERSLTRKTPIDTILNNLSRYRYNDLESIANQYSDGAWDIEPGTSREQLEADLREALEEYAADMTPLQRQAPREGFYVRPIPDDAQFQSWDMEEGAPVQQEISSAATSINANKLPVLYTNKNAVFTPGGTNVDVGGGRFDNVTEYLGERGVRNMIFDPYNRDDEYNRRTLMFLTSGNRADTATCSNCLNVIREAPARANVILECAKAIKPDGKAYFTVYEGDGSGVGKVTKSGWQENRKTASYVDEIKRYFDKVTPRGKIIVAEQPKANLPKAAWETTPGKAVWYQRWDMTEGDTAAESNGRNLAYTRLQSENKILKDTVKALNKLTGKQSTTIEKLQERLRLNKTPEVREDDAKKMARSLLREYGSKADSEAVARQLKEIGDYILQTSTDKVSEEEIKSRARAVAAEIIDAASEQISVDGEYMAEIVSSIRGNDGKGKKLTIDDAFLGELDQAGGFEAFRRRNFGKFTLAKRSGSYDASQYMSVSQFYTDLQNNYGKSYFPDAANEGEEIIRIADAFDLARPMEVNPFEQYMGEAVEDLANRIAMDTMGGILRAEPAKYADVEYRKEKSRNEELNERIKKLEAENALSHEEAGRLWNQVSDLTTKLDLAETQYAALQKAAEARLEQVRAEGRERETEIKAREREKAARDMKALKDHFKEVQKDARARREESAGVSKYREQVRKKTKALYEMLMKNDDKKHVPEVLKAPLAEFLTEIDFTSRRKLRGGAETRNDAAFMDSIQKLQTLLENQQRYINGDNSVESNLGGYIDVSGDSLKFLRETASLISQAMRENSEYTVNQMNAAKLKELSNFLSNLKTAIGNMNSFMANARYQSVAETADADISRMEELGKASMMAGNSAHGFLMWKEGTPYYVFKRFGEGGKSIFNGLARGWEKLAFNAQEIVDFAEKAYTTEEVQKWKKDIHDFTLDDGTSIRITTAQIMELSMLLNREQAVKHISKGGFCVGDIKTTKYGISGKISDSGNHHLTAEDISLIVGTLTDRQAEVARTLQRYMATKGAEWGNEISMRRYGYKFYTEGEEYYPIKTKPTDRPAPDQDNMENSMFRLLNLSSSKPLDPRASNALVVNDIFDTFANHLSDMAKLNGLGLPILDAIKWFNYKERIDNGDGTYNTRTMQAAMKEAFGQDALNYFRTLMKDVNGATESGDRGTEGVSGVISRYKISAVASNLRVALLQPTSYVRATTVIDPKHLVGILPSKAAYNEAMKYSGTAVWKAQGHYDTNIAKSMQDQIEHNETLRDKITEKSMILAELGDKLTWSMLWTASKRQAKANNPGLSGEALCKAAAEVFMDVIYSSQVMDSTLTRSEIMRSKSEWNKMTSAFMAEPTLSYNILLDAYSEYQLDARRNGKRGAWARNSGKIGRAFAVYVSSAAFSAIVESLADAARDDGDDDFLDKWLKAFLGSETLNSENDFWTRAKSLWLDGNLGQDLTILGKLPFIKDMMSILQGFSSSNMTTAGFESLLKAVEIFRGNGSKKLTAWGKTYKYMQPLSQLSGFAISNFMRDAVAIWNLTVAEAKPDWKLKKYDDYALSGEKLEMYKTHAEPAGIGKSQYQKMLKAANTNGNSSVTQDELATYLTSELADGTITEAQADAVWDAQGWKKTRGEYKPKATQAEPTEKPAETQTNLPMNGARAEAPAAAEGMSYEDFKKTAPLYSDKRASTYRAWEANLKPAGITLEQFSSFLVKADIDGNSSLKQDELGNALRGAVTNGEMTAEQAVAVWNAQGWKTSLATWASKH